MIARAVIAERGVADPRVRQHGALVQGEVAEHEDAVLRH
jgi:hypothetical protein